jgi:hypothetical protein
VRLPTLGAWAWTWACSPSQPRRTSRRRPAGNRSRP